MKNWKRILSLLLVLTMCLTLLPVSALAEEWEDGTETAEAVEEVEEESCEHVFDAVVTEPSCTEGGYTTFTCSLCGYTFDADFTDPLGHDLEDVEAVEPGCTVPGHTAGVVCARCGEVLEGCEELEALGHTPVEVEELAPQPGASGHTAGVACARCGEVLEGCEELAALPAEESGEDETPEAEPVLAEKRADGGVIVGFETPEEIELEVKRDLYVLEQLFPAELRVKLGGTVYYRQGEDGESVFDRAEAETEALVPVSWHCEEDYDEALELFHFTAEFEGYALAEGLAPPVLTVRVDAEFVPPPLGLLPSSDEPEIPIGGGLSRDRGTLPSSYSNKSKLPTARDQGDYGTCWAFATIGTLEADLIHDGKATSSIDLSELHLAHFMYCNYSDEKGCNTGDEVDLYSGSWLRGGNVGLAYEVLANHVGPATESRVPYSRGASYNPSASEGRGANSSYQLAGAYKYNIRDTAGIKQAIMDHGGVAVAFCYEEEIYSSTYSSYNYTATSNPNHAVMLVGWDDSFSASRFRSGYKPSKNGAWLVRNSWGTRWGQSGYFWISYENKSWDAYAYAFDGVSTAYDHVYAYDNSPVTTWRTRSSGATASQEFTVDPGESIRAVGVETTDAGVTLSVTVSADGKTATATKMTGQPGYYLIPLNSTIPISTRCTATASVSYSGSGTVGIPMEYSQFVFSAVLYTAKCASGLSIDGQYMDRDGRIKLFTNDEDFTYTVNYNANGGSGAPASQVKFYGVPLTLSTQKPSRADDTVRSYTVTLDAGSGSVSPTSLVARELRHYTFQSWNTSSYGTGTVYHPGDSYTRNDPVTLYAQWTNETGVESVTLPTPTRSGYTFKGWSENTYSTSGVTGSYTPKKDITLYATWEPEMFTVLESGVCGKNGDNLTWKLTADGSLTIQGTGEMEDYYYNQPWTKSKVKSLSVFADVTSIGDYALSGCENLKRISLPNGLVSIGEYAFSDCSSLTYVSIPDSVSSVGEGAFADCSAMTWASLPMHTVTLGSFAFSGCTSMDHIYVWDGLTSIGYKAFENCTSLTSISIPGTVTSIGDYAFQNCSSLTEFDVNFFNEFYCSDELGVLYSLNMTELIAIPGATSGSFRIPAGVTDIHFGAFSYCGEITDVLIPSGVATIENAVFWNCSKLKSVTLPLSLTSIGASAFDGCGSLRDVYYRGTAQQWGAITIGGYNTPLSNASKHYNTAPTVLLSGECGKNGGNLTWTLDADGVFTISGSGEMADYENYYNDPPWLVQRDSIWSVVVADGVTSLGTDAFYRCSNLVSVTLPDSLITLGGAFDFCTNLRNITVPASVTSIGAGAFYGCENLTALPLSESVTSIGAAAFNGCTSLKSFTIPSRVKRIERYTFADCDSLTDFTIPPDVSFLGESAFRGCNKLAEITIPASVTSVSAMAFEYCFALTDVYYSGTLQQWQQIAFDYENDELLDAALHCSGSPTAYRIIYRAYGATGVPQPQYKLENTPLVLSNAVPTRENESAGSFTVTLDANGGSVSPATLSAETATGYRFRSWNTDYSGEGTGYNSGGTYTANASANLYAQWDSHAVTSPVTLPAAAPRTGYDFVGWATRSTEIGAEYQAGEAFTPEGDTTLYARWNAKTYTITYDANGGEEPPPQQTKAHDMAIELSWTVPTLEGYDFVGWATSRYAQTAQYQPGDIYTAEGDITLYALWTIRTYPVSYDANGGSGAPADQIKTHGVGLTLSSTRPTHASDSTGSYTVSLNANGGSVSPATLTAARSIAYPFVNWNTEAEGGGTGYDPGASYTANEPVTLFAQWSQQATTAAVELPTPTRYGYGFKGWSEDPNASSGVKGSYTPLKNVTLYAIWEAGTYTIHYDAKGGSGAPADQIKTHGQTLTLSSAIPTLTGYDFIGWATSATATSAQYRPGDPYTAEGDATLYAVWKAWTYPVSYNANGGTGAPANQTKTHNVALTLSSVQPTHASESAGSYTVTLDPNNGSVNPTTLNAARTTNYSFASWNTAQNGGGTSYAPGASYTANASVTLYAQWTPSTTTAAVTLPTPTREGYDFLGWGENAQAETGVFGRYTPYGDVTLYAVWAEHISFELPDGFTLDHAYLVLKPGNTAKLAPVGLDETAAKRLVWTASADGTLAAADALPITVDGSGLVTAQGLGTAYAVAYLRGSDGEPVFLARCRVDVVADTVSAAVEGVRLPVTKLTAELYSTDYAVLPVELVLTQNKTSAVGDQFAPVNSGSAVTEAQFLDAATAAVFELRPRDDRTLELVPKDRFVNGDAATVKTLKSSYKSALAVTVEGERYTTPVVTITLKKTAPKLTAKGVKLNSFLADTQEVVFTGGTPKEITVVSAPGWLTPTAQGGKLTLTYNRDLYPNGKFSGKLNLTVKPAGWAVEVPVTVSVSAAKTAPKLSFKPNSLSLQPKTGDCAWTAATITPAALADTELLLESITEGGMSYPNNKALYVEIVGRDVFVTEGQTPQRDGKAHTYKVNISAGGEKPVTLTVKLLAADTVSFTAKASGAIDLAIPHSPVTIVPTLKNYSSEAYCEITKITNAYGVNVGSLFETDGLQIMALGNPAVGSYTAELTLTLGNGTTKTTTVPFTVKRSAKTPAASVTLKASGSIDVIRPGTAVVLTPTIKNRYGHVLSAADLVFCKNGVSIPQSKLPFTVEVENGTFVVTQSGKINHVSDKYTVGMAFDGLSTAKSIAVPIKMGASKIAQSTKTVTLLKDDRFDRASIRLTPEAGLPKIAEVVLTGPKNPDGTQVFTLIPLGGGEYAIGYNGNELPLSGKGGAVKLQVYLEGNETANNPKPAPNATLSVSVTLG